MVLLYWSKVEAEQARREGKSRYLIRSAKVAEKMSNGASTTTGPSYLLYADYHWNSYLKYS